jgi:hypothetical protein
MFMVFTVGVSKNQNRLRFNIIEYVLKKKKIIIIIIKLSYTLQYKYTV